MKKISLITLTFYLVQINLIYAQCKLDYSHYHLVYSDNFNTYASPYNLLSQYFITPQPSPYLDSFGWGVEYYTIYGIALNQGGGIRLGEQPDNRIVQINPDGHGWVPRSVNYRSGMIWTKNTYLYGMFEINCSIHGMCWPAFWLPGYGSPTEIDILDNNVFDPDHQMQNRVIDWKSGNSLGEFYDKIGGTDFAANNTYTAVWTPTRVTFFLNGREMYTINDTAISIYPIPLPVVVSLEMASWMSSSSSYIDVNYLKIYQANTDPNTGLPDYYSYQNFKSYVNTNLFENTSSPTKVSTAPKSIAVNEVYPDLIYYRGIDGYLYQAQKVSTGWFINKIYFNWAAPLPAALIGGDLTMAGADKIFYKGQDNRLQLWGWDNVHSVWYQDYIDDPSGPTNFKVSTAPYSITNGNNEIYYIGADGKIQKYYWSVSAMVHDYVPYTYGSSELAEGDLIIDKTNTPSTAIAYRGKDNLLQILQYSSGSYIHSWVTTSTAYISSTPGSVAGGYSGEYYFAGTDHKLHHYYKSSTGFQVDNTLESYPYGTGGVGTSDLIYGNISFDASNDRILYIGNDARLQYFVWASPNWMHGWIDDYWNTSHFMSYGPSTSGNSSLVSDLNSGTYYYNGACQFTASINGSTVSIDESQNIRRFAWEPCEVLNPPNQTNANNWSAWTVAAKMTSSGINTDTTHADENYAYPNPSTTGCFYIQSKDEEDLKIETISEKNILELNGHSGTIKIDMSNQPNGIYILSVREQGKIMKQKLIIAR